MSVRVPSGINMVNRRGFQILPFLQFFAFQHILDRIVQLFDASESVLLKVCVHDGFYAHDVFVTALLSARQCNESNDYDVSLLFGLEIVEVVDGAPTV